MWDFIQIIISLNVGFALGLLWAYRCDGKVEVTVIPEETSDYGLSASGVNENRR